MKTRIVLSFDENEFARLAGAASARGLSCKDFVMKLARGELPDPATGEIDPQDIAEGGDGKVYNP